MANAGPSTAPELTPKQLAEQWKRQGGLDALRKQLLQDFLASPDRDQLLSSLDTLLPTLLSSSTTLTRLPRKDRPAAVLRTLQQRSALREPVGKLEGELRSGKGKGKRVERELRRCLCEARGCPTPSSPQAFAMPASTSQPVAAAPPAPSSSLSDPPAQPTDTSPPNPPAFAPHNAPEPTIEATTAAQDAHAGVETTAEVSRAADGDVEMADAAAPTQNGSSSTTA
uniref:BY PROTMAP: gi/342319868/gb/EGU11813.1/ Proteophosphoglycan 5 [Rhodotorula glutinis ATCC 204091] n=1 Tax=Rhodotorula toruloides TaxID=5286 RepID=A0A0K3CBN3_RHOTO